MLKYPQQAQGWERVPSFWRPQALSVPKGRYVELNFTMRSWVSEPCAQGYYLEIRDGSSQSADVLGVFCGDHKTVVVRSSRRYMWLRFASSWAYHFNGLYIGRFFNQTGTMFCW